VRRSGNRDRWAIVVASATSATVAAAPTLATTRLLMMTRRRLGSFVRACQLAQPGQLHRQRDAATGVRRRLGESQRPRGRPARGHHRVASPATKAALSAAHQVATQVPGVRDLSYASTGDPALVAGGGRSTLMLVYPPLAGDPVPHR
jgi:hypothetical protein